MSNSLIVPGAPFAGGPGLASDGSLGHLQETILKHLVCDQAPPTLRYRHAWAYGGGPSSYSALKTAFLAQNFTAGWPSGSYYWVSGTPGQWYDYATSAPYIDPGFTLYRDPDTGNLTRYGGIINTPYGTIAQSMIYYEPDAQAAFASARSEWVTNLGFCVSGWNTWSGMPGETDIGIVRGQVEVLGGAPVYYCVANAQVTPGSPASIAYAFVQDGILAPGASIEAPLPAAAPGGSVVQNINLIAFLSYNDWLSSLGG